jgi:hypothetical protein
VSNKIFTLFVLIFLLFSLFAGCIDNDNSTETKSSLSHIDGADFSSVKNAYFGEEIEFNALQYDDSGKKIKNYYWDFGDGGTAEGSKVSHTYDFNNEYEIEYPLIYSVTLMAFDGSESISTTHLVKLYPKEFRFYLEEGRLTNDLPIENKQNIGTTGIIIKDNQNELVYELEESIDISACNWILTLNLEKPILLKINKISITFFDAYSNEIATLDKRIGLLSYGKHKTFEIEGSFDKEFTIKSIKISFEGFSIGENIKVLYGDDKPSNICFNIKN